MSAVAAFSRWLFLLLSLSSWTITYAKETRIVCYYTNWSVYRPGDAKFTPQNINPYLCTHLIYAFGGFTKENTLKPFDKYQDIEKGGYAKFTGLKTYNKNLKTMLAIGGWNEGSARFSPLVANEVRRKELVKNAIKFLRQNHFDGLDLDWEYPAFRDGGKPRDRDNYAQFVEELREEFERESEKTGRPRLLLTMAVPAGIEYINKGYDIPKLTRYLDWMNILSYDFHSAFEPAVNHHAPLYALEEDNEYNYDAELNIDYMIKHYLKLGADPSKLVLGIPTYGRSYTLFNPDAYEIGSPADGPGTMGEATRENGYLAYYEICDYIKNQDWEVDEPNPNAMGPYAFKDNQWVGYDDEKIVRKKAEYVAENGLGGIMFWAIDNDDFRGNCHGKSYPLIEAGKEALLQANGITEDNLIAPPAKPIKSRTRTRTKNTEKTVGKYDEKEVKVDKLSNRRRNNRVKSTVKEEEVKEKEVKEVPTSRRKLRRNKSTTTEEPTTHSSLKVITPSYTTPAPPSTPDMGGAFKCEEEGFFPHPKDCKKYFWCLSGAGDSGLIAHQFTCPAGLYFNKAADSCDYTQNVLCNKKLQKPKSTSTSSPSATTSSTTTTTEGTTSRVPPKITAATSKYTVRFSTTTEATEEEYDDEYEDEEDEPSRKSSSSNDAEEDPQVIKELIDLIKKAGGIEQLERQLQLNEKNADSSRDKTTESTVGKSLYERVLSKALKSTLNSKKATYTGLRNSKGPQSETTNDKSSTKEKINRGTLQYTSISRNRPSSTENVEKDQNEEISEKSISEVTKATRTFKKPTDLQYVNIRRGRVSSTTEVPETNSVLNRNKILGEGSFEDEDEETEDEINEADTNENEKNNKKTFTPQYVNIRRQRPSTTEGPSTSKYVEIRRSTTKSTDDKFNEDETTSKYQTIKRGTTVAPVSEEDAATGNKRRPTTENPGGEVSSPKYVNIRQSTTNDPISTDEQGISGASQIIEETTTVTSGGTPSSEPTSPKANSPDDESDLNQEIVTSTESSELSRRRNTTQITQRPSIFISRSTTVRSTTEPTTQTLKTRQSTRPHFRVGVRRKPTTYSPSSTAPTTILSTTPAPPLPFAISRPTKIIPPRRKYFAHTTASRILESQETSTKPYSEVRFKFPTRRTSTLAPTTQETIRDYTADQTLQSTHMVISNEDMENSESIEAIIRTNGLEKSTSPLLDYNTVNLFTDAITRKYAKVSSPATQYKKTTESSLPQRLVVKSTTPRIVTYISKPTPFPSVSRKTRKPIRTTTQSKPNIIHTQDKYDDFEASIFSMLPAQSKVLIHSNGNIECLDQGNFPHPVSCKKFISCARMGRGRIYGWEYTCPKNLSFDPIGGMCNWAADLDCVD